MRFNINVFILISIHINSVTWELDHYWKLLKSLYGLLKSFIIPSIGHFSLACISLTHEQTEDVQPDKHLSAGALDSVDTFSGTREVVRAVLPWAVSGSAVFRQPLLELRATVHRIQILHDVLALNLTNTPEFHFDKSGNKFNFTFETFFQVQ